MRILILNWRDIKNPTGGGAEILTHEIAKRWVKKGHLVTQFSSLFEGALKEEMVDGVKIIRRGHPDARYLFYSIHFLAFIYYLKMFRNKIDVVIDEIHGLPFFTPWYIKEKKVALICEVADDLWIKIYGRIFGALGRFVEILFLRYIYNRTPYVTISNSTKDDLVKNGVGSSCISVLPMGFNIPESLKKYKKESIPTCIIVGRLFESKGIKDAILSINELRRGNHIINLWVVGQGDDSYKEYLVSLSKELNLEKQIVFYGYVTDAKKFELMSKAHILVSPSIKEGFGLTIPEAGRVGIPSVVYNSKGLSEIVINKKTGLICSENSPINLAKNILLLLTDKKLYRKLSTAAEKRSYMYNWDNTAKEFLEILQV